jgi:hypothetical protein
MSTRNPSWGWRLLVRRAGNLTIIMCQLSRNSGTSAFWNPKGPTRPVAGKLYYFLLVFKPMSFSHAVVLLFESGPVDHFASYPAECGLTWHRDFTKSRVTHSHLTVWSTDYISPFNIKNSAPYVFQWPGRKSDHSSSSEVEVKNRRVYTSAQPVCLLGMYRDKFTFYLIP